MSVSVHVLKTEPISTAAVRENSHAWLSRGLIATHSIEATV